MNKALIALFAAVFSLVLVVDDAEARRIGGGRSSGMQRSITPPAAPARNVAPAKPAQPAAAPQASGMSRWLGPASAWPPCSRTSAWAKAWPPSSCCC